MRRIFLWTVALLLWGEAGVVQAQIEINWALEHRRTVLMEPVIATVRIVNQTGIELDLTPGGNARLGFDVEDQPTSFVPFTGNPLVREAPPIPNGETHDVVVNLLDAYRILYGQSYMLTPFVEVGGMRFFGKRGSLEVQPGLELLKRNYGMPSLGTAREVSLRLIHRDRIDHLFFCIDNTETGFCLGVYDLGSIIRFFTPQLELDAEKIFHVLQQTTPDRFRYSSFGYDGTPLKIMYYAGQVGSIQMVRDEAGAITVVGGTAYVEDLANPGSFVAPAVPPSRPFQFMMGEFQKKGKRTPEERRRGTKVVPLPKDKRGVRVD